MWHPCFTQYGTPHHGEYGDYVYSELSFLLVDVRVHVLGGGTWEHLATTYAILMVKFTVSE